MEAMVSQQLHDSSINRDGRLSSRPVLVRAQQFEPTTIPATGLVNRSHVHPLLQLHHLQSGPSGGRRTPPLLLQPQMYLPHFHL